MCFCWNIPFREGQGSLRENTGRNVISHDSARVSVGGSSIGGRAAGDDVGGAMSVEGLFSSTSRHASVGGGEENRGGFNHRMTASEPPPVRADCVAVTQKPEPSVPSSSYWPNGNGDRCRTAATAGLGAEVEPAYLFTDMYPFTYKQFDRQEEERLKVSKHVVVPLVS